MRWIIVLALVVLVVALGYVIMWRRSAPMEPWRHRRRSTLDLRDRASFDAPGSRQEAADVRESPDAQEHQINPF